jgi:hypothetical protein
LVKRTDWPFWTQLKTACAFCRNSSSETVFTRRSLNQANFNFNFKLNVLLSIALVNRESGRMTGNRRVLRVLEQRRDGRADSTRVRDDLGANRNSRITRREEGTRKDTKGTKRMCMPSPRLYSTRRISFLRALRVLRGNFVRLRHNVPLSAGSTAATCNKLHQTARSASSFALSGIAT